MISHWLQQEDRVHQVIALYGYNNGGAVLTLVLPLGFFIVVTVALYFVFSKPHTVPGHRPITGAKPVAPAGEGAPSIAAATGFPTATSAGGAEPLASRATPPTVGARAGEAAAAAEAAEPAGDEAGGQAAEKAAGEPGPGRGTDQDDHPEGPE
jgi:hypothetical protein